MGKVIRVSDEAYEFLENLQWERRIRSMERLIDDILDDCFSDENE